MSPKAVLGLGAFAVAALIPIAAIPFLWWNEHNPLLHDDPRLHGIWRSDKERTLAQDDIVERLAEDDRAYLEKELGKMYYVIDENVHHLYMGDLDMAYETLWDKRDEHRGRMSNDSWVHIDQVYSVNRSTDTKIVITTKKVSEQTFKVVEEGRCLSVSMGPGWHGMREYFCRVYP